MLSSVLPSVRNTCQSALQVLGSASTRIASHSYHAVATRTAAAAAMHQQNSSSTRIVSHSYHAVATRTAAAAAMHQQNSPSLLARLAPFAVPCQLQQSRSVIKFSLEDGTRQTEMGVIKRFTRLHWGGWIRPHASCSKKLWSKRGDRVWRGKQFVMLNTRQSKKLDKMVGTYYRVRRYYPDDPLKHYHCRESYWSLRRKPYLAKDERPEPFSLTKKQLEENWYKVMGLEPGKLYKRPHKVMLRYSHLGPNIPINYTIE